MRKTPAHPEVYEDPVPIYNVKVKLNIPLKNVKVKTVISGATLPVTITDKCVEVIVPKIDISEIVCFEIN